MTQHTGPSVPEIAAMLTDRADQLVQQLLPASVRVGHEYHVGSSMGEAGQSLKIGLTGKFAGKWKDFARQEGGDLIDLIAATQRISNKEAVKWAKDWLGLTGERPKVRPATNTERKPKQNVDASAKARELWDRSTPIAGTLGETYLQRRGIRISPGPWVRFIESLDYWHMTKAGKMAKLGAWPALLCGVAIWPHKEPIALQRIYLERDGSRKALIPNPDDPAKLLDVKKTLASPRGGAVRLSRMSKEIWIAEGVETALSVLQRRPDITVWAALGTSNIAHVDLPDDIEEVTLVLDGDEAARKAAGRFCARHQDAPFSITAVEAAKDKDFNDHLRESANG